MSVGENIRLLRLGKRWTQAGLGKRAGLTQRAISDHERGIQPDARAIRRLATALGVSESILTGPPIQLPTEPPAGDQL